MLRKRIFILLLVMCHFMSLEYCRAQDKLSKEKIAEFFDDVLLIINFNHPYYDNIPFLKEIYGPYFKNIVFYGEAPHPDINVISHQYGWYVHRAINDAMVKWPTFRGYICCQDDCFMNFWNFPRLDKDKIWFHVFWTASLNCPTHSWPWWNYTCGWEASTYAYKKLSQTASSFLEYNCGNQAFAFSWADFIYVSGKYRDSFIEVNDCFNNPNVFIEIALPTIALCLDKYDNMEHVNPYWGGTINTIDLTTYSPSVDWVHPIKFSKEENREFIRNVLINQVR